MNHFHILNNPTSKLNSYNIKVSYCLTHNSSITMIQKYSHQITSTGDILHNEYFDS